MSSSNTTAVLPNYGPIVTSQLIGSLLNFFFFGALLMQVYVYRLCFPKDAPGVKFLVYFIFLIQTVCICLNAADVEFWFGTGFGDITHIADPRNSAFYGPLIGAFIGMLVQLFFACRIVVVRRAAWPLALLIALISLAHCAGGMGVGILSFMRENDTLSTVLVYLWFIAGATADVLIAGVMTYFLFTPTAPRAPKRDIVKSAVCLVIETNALTAIVALVRLILFVGVANTTYWACPMIILPGIYANTLLVSLNTRARLLSDSSDSADGDAGGSLAFPSIEAPRSSNNSRAPLARSGTAYSANGLGRVLSVPAMSFARRAENGHEQEDEKDTQSLQSVTVRGGSVKESMQEKEEARKSFNLSGRNMWRDADDADEDAGADSESEYASSEADVGVDGRV